MERNSLRKFGLCIVLFAVLSVPFMGEAQENQQLSLTDLTGLPVVETPEAQLPAGAIGYLRANNIEVLLTNLDSMLMSFVPEKVTPPEFQPFLSEPHPIIAFLTTQAFGQPVETGKLGSMIGVALDRPVSVALYPMPPQKGILVSLPIADPMVLTNMLQNMLMPESIEQGTIGEVSYYKVTSWNPGLPPELYVMASETNVFLCGSIEVAQMLVNSANRGTMAAESVMSKSIAKYADRDLTLIVSPGLLKAQLPFFKQQAEMAIIPAFETLREELEEIPPADRLMIDARLRLQFGIEDLEQLVDYAEAYSTSISKVLLDQGVQYLMNLNGLALALDIEEALQTLALTLFSLDIQPQQFTQPLPLDAMKQALPTLPGVKSTLMASGHAPEAASSKLFTAILNAIEQELQNKGLPMQGFLAYKTYYLAKQPCPSLESRVPWTLKTIIPTFEKLDFSQYASLWELLQAVTNRFSGAPLFLPVALMPTMAEDVVAQYFTEKAEIITQNAQRYQEMRQELPFRQPFFSASSQFSQEEISENLKKLTFETAYTTRRGFFGYQQHELVNRKIMFQKSLPDYEMLYDANADLSRLEALLNAEQAPVPASVSKLLEQIPANATKVSVFRTLYLVEDLLRALTDTEALIHREMDTFLAEVQDIVETSGEENLEEKLLDAGLDVPLFLAAVHLDEDGNVYGRLPGGLHYPRPAAMPHVTSLFEDFLAVVSEVGGSTSFIAVHPEELEIASIQSTEALAVLVKSVVNTFYETYMSRPEGMELLMTNFAHPEDLQDRSEEEIFANPMWEGLEDLDDLEIPFLKTQGSRQNRTKADMRAIGTALGSYMVDFNFFPAHLELTNLWNVELPPEYYGGSYVDGWEMPFQYVSTDSGSQYLLISYGKDQVPGYSDSDFDEDIVYMNGAFLTPDDEYSYGNQEERMNEALITAIHENATGMVDILLQVGADPNTTDLAGQSALSIAKDLGFNVIVGLLEEAGAVE